MVLLPSIIVFYYTSGFAKMRAHYFISLYPFVAIASGYVLYYVFNKLKDKWQKVLLAVLVFGFGLYLSGNLVTTLARKDTRVELYEWMSVNIKDEDFLVYTTSSFLPVVEKFSDNETDKGYEQNEVIGKSGYIIADTGKEEFEEDVYDGKFKKTYSISAHDKRGPYIHIYEF